MHISCLFVDPEKENHGKVASSGLSARGFCSCMVRNSFLGTRLPELPCITVSSCISHFPSLPKPSFHHLWNRDIIVAASSGCCKDEIYIWHIKCFLKGLAPSRCSMSHSYYYYYGHCFIFKLWGKSSSFRDQDTKGILKRCRNGL